MSEYITHPSYHNLKPFAREELRQYARDLGIKIGGCKNSTMLNILSCSKARVKISLLIPMPDPLKEGLDDTA